MTSEKSTNETETKGLLNEIEALREKFTNTQELYREVCALLFFRHGVTPTANRLYQLVRKGSMNAPAEALGEFWRTLREKSRVRIEHPDIPAELNGTAGEALAAIWKQALRMAEANTEAIRSEALAAAMAAKQERDLAQAGFAKLEAELDETKAALQDSRNREARMAEELSREKETRITTEAQVRQAEELTEELRRGIEASRETYAQGLENQRIHLVDAEARHQSEITRMRKELDEARLETDGWRKEHERATVNVAKHTGQELLRYAKLEAELETYKQKAILLEAALADFKTERKQVRTLLQGVIPLPLETSSKRKAKRIIKKRPGKSKGG